MRYYEKGEPTIRVSVLGTEYRIYLNVPESEDELLKSYDGYCDKTTHRITVSGRSEECDLEEYGEYRKQVLRHEIIHAFLFESGLSGDAVWHVSGQEHPEQTIDWLARQFPKILKAFQEVGAL